VVTTSRSARGEPAIGITPSAIRPARLTAAGPLAAGSTGRRARTGSGFTCDRAIR
jgi:hypothetical protein